MTYLGAEAFDRFPEDISRMLARIVRLLPGWQLATNDGESATIFFDEGGIIEFVPDVELNLHERNQV